MLILSNISNTCIGLNNISIESISHALKYTCKSHFLGLKTNQRKHIQCTNLHDFWYHMFKLIFFSDYIINAYSFLRIIFCDAGKPSCFLRCLFLGNKRHTPERYTLCLKISWPNTHSLSSHFAATGKTKQDKYFGDFNFWHTEKRTLFLEISCFLWYFLLILSFDVCQNWDIFLIKQRTKAWVKSNAVFLV